MPTVNELTTQDTVVGSDQILFYSTVNGQSRKAPMTAVLEYVEANINTDLEPIPLKSYLLADLPSAVANPYAMVYCLNGNAGAACVAVSNGTDWKVVALGATVS
jgi:hypothetical protein